MTHSIELLPDAAADELIRGQWTTLAEAGLANQGDVRTGTNRPHATLLAAPSIDPAALSALAPVAMRLPITCRLGALVVFGSGLERTLARLVVPSAELLSIHATVVRLASPLLSQTADAAPFAHSSVGNWSPHVTLARRLTPVQVAYALSVLDGADAPITFSALRQWDGDAKTQNVLSGRDC